MRYIWSLLISATACHALAQNTDAIHQQFCTNLYKVLESGRRENFESLNGTLVKQSPLLPVPGYSIKLEPFPITYVDKDRRFVGKTNQNFDSLSALRKADELKDYIKYCMDSTQWTWSEAWGDDSTTVFFKELKQLKANETMFTIAIAVDAVAPKVYNVNLYIKRNRR
jgi:hypothetical protein